MVTISGLKELQAALKELPKATETRVVQDTMKVSLQPMLLEASRLAPKDEGDLADAIQSSTKVIPSQRSEVPRKGRHKILLFAGPLYSRFSGYYAPHAHLVEFGTRERKGRGVMPAQPFMRPAFDMHVAGFIKQFSGELVGMIEAAATRQRKRQERKLKREERKRQKEQSGGEGAA